MYRGNIIEDIRKDRTAGADRLVAEYKNRLYNVAYGICGDEHEAEDLVFCTFEQVIAKIDDYQEQDAFFGWMCTILRNYHKMSVRAAVARNTVPSGGLGELAGLIGGTATDGMDIAIDGNSLGLLGALGLDLHRLGLGGIVIDVIVVLGQHRASG